MYYIELHIHSSRGSLDSLLDIEELVKECKRIGINGVCITEHIEWRMLSLEEYSNLYSCCKMQKNTVDFFPGAEVKLQNGHEYLVIGVEIPIEWFSMRWDEAVSKIHQIGGIVIKSHPYRDENVVIPYDGVELYNFCSNDSMNELTKEYVRKHPNMIYTCGSDAHSADVVGMAITALPHKPSSGVELARMIRNKEISYYILEGLEYKKDDLI